MGFNEDGEDIIKLASRIKTFSCEGSTMDILEDNENHVSHDDLVYGDCNND